MNQEAGLDVVLKISDNVGWIIINRLHKRNSINMNVATMIREVLGQWKDDPSVKAVMLTGAGDVAFCAGNDLTEFHARKGDQTAMRQFDDAVSGMHGAIKRFPKPMIAVVNGYCLGGGITLLGGCDIALASSAARFGLPELARGFWPAAATTPIMHTLHQKHALSLILTAENIPAEEAMMMGLISRVVPAEALAEAATTLARLLGSYDIDALRWAKEMAFASIQMDYQTSMRLGFIGMQAYQASTSAFASGIEDFVNKSSAARHKPGGGGPNNPLTR